MRIIRLMILMGAAVALGGIFQQTTNIPPITEAYAEKKVAVAQPKSVEKAPEKPVESPVVEKPVEQPVVPAPAPPPATPVYSGSHTDWMTQAGIAPADWVYVDFIVNHESHWCPTIWNGETGCPAYHGYNHYKAYGICQSLPPEKMAKFGADWETNPVTQLKWCSDYAHNRYGGWAGAYLAWNRQKWW